jgi:hypothetical protein
MKTKIFHPNIHSSGEICVSTLKKDWSSKYGIEHILLVIKCLLISPNPDSALDAAAGRLLQDVSRREEQRKVLLSPFALCLIVDALFPSCRSIKGLLGVCSYCLDVDPDSCQPVSVLSHPHHCIRDSIIIVVLFVIADGGRKI